MPPPGAHVSDIFREIDEELRRDNLRKLWSHNGKYLITKMLLVMLIIDDIVA